jgi:DNA-binding response OmpR family regulator
MSIKNNLLIIGTKNFNNSFNDIKEYLNFSLVFYDKNTFTESLTQLIDILIIDSEISNDEDVLDLIFKFRGKPLLLFKKKNFVKTIKINCDDTVSLPSSLVEISNRAKNLIASNNFLYNSSVKIKEYIIDKNERRLKKNNVFITITEREIQLIELLFTKKKPISKKNILKEVWKYSDDADTHTIETHIYRLRKKILDKFKDENFIINSKSGYSI